MDVGICELGGINKYWNDEKKESYKKLEYISKPFPLTKQWVWEGQDKWGEEDEKRKEKLGFGNLFIKDDGCGMEWYLIVTGKERGNMWMYADVGIGPTDPRMDFLTWYENYLDGKNLLEPGE